MKSMIHKHKDKDKGKGFIECDYCGELFVKGEPFCPCCGKPAEEILRGEKESGCSKNGY